jgi:hypothetical protein
VHRKSPHKKTATSQRDGVTTPTGQSGHIQCSLGGRVLSQSDTARHRKQKEMRVRRKKAMWEEDLNIMWMNII